MNTKYISPDEHIVNESLELCIRLVNAQDNENLRAWKNANREYFFFNQLISQEQQENWYLSYQSRAWDHMFIVTFKNIDIGCMGIRLTGDYWDIYNVILGDNNYAGKGLMSQSFKKMLSLALDYKADSVMLNVLKENSAIQWYKKNGFIIQNDYNNYYSMQLSFN